MDTEVKLKAGDLVEVLSYREIKATLDSDGALEGVPFMPEMAPCCGGRFQVGTVMTAICGGGGRGGMRAVRGGALLLLGDLRCDGAAHGCCSRLCTLLWKAAWLKPAAAPCAGPEPVRCRPEEPWPYPIRGREGGYHCQATVLGRETLPLSKGDKLRRALTDIAAGELRLRSFLKMCARSVSYRGGSLRRRFFTGGGRGGRTPTESLSLQPGDLVEVKSAREIAATLDQTRANRGLVFSEFMTPYCGGVYRVRSRVENYIDERTGAMKKLKDTVILEGITCGGETTSGKCRRAEYFFWREIWLRKARPAGGLS